MKPIILTLAFLFSSHTIANTAYISTVGKSNNGVYSSTTCFHATNISDVDINVTFTLFDPNGNIYTTPITKPINISAIGQPSLLRPNQHVFFCLPLTAPTYIGHGKIDAVAVDGISRSVLATAQANFTAMINGIDAGIMGVTINGGMPF